MPQRTAVRRPNAVPNRGAERRSARREPGDTAMYVLSGPLRWVDTGGSHAALLVDDANSCGRRLIGQTLTLDLAATAIRSADRDGDGERTCADLLPGERVTIKARLEAGILAAPDVIKPLRLIAGGP